MHGLYNRKSAKFVLIDVFGSDICNLTLVTKQEFSACSVGSVNSNYLFLRSIEMPKHSTEYTKQYYMHEIKSQFFYLPVQFGDNAVELSTHKINGY